MQGIRTEIWNIEAGCMQRLRTAVGDIGECALARHRQIARALPLHNGEGEKGERGCDRRRLDVARRHFVQPVM